MKQYQKNKVCPFITVKHSIHYGIYLLAGDDEYSYLCHLNGGPAMGGQQRNSIPGGANTPCSLEYAVEQCSLYKTKTEGK